MTGPHPIRRHHRIRAVAVAATGAVLALTAFAGPAAATTAPAPTPLPDFGVNSVPPGHPVDAETVPTHEVEAAPAPSSDFGVAQAPPRGLHDAKTLGTDAGADADVTAAAIGPPAVSVSPTTGLNPAGGSAISVSGSGFDPTANNSFGIYVVFGPVDPGVYFKDANRFLAAVWLHPGGGASGSPGQGELQSNGSFSATLPVLGGLALTAQYTDGNGTSVNCLTTQCYVVTMAAHGVDDRTKDTCTPVTFAGATAVPAVDSTCQPVATPAGQPSNPGATGTTGGGAGSTTTGGTTSGGTSSGAASSAKLPNTGTTTGPTAALGLGLLASGLGLMHFDRRRARKSIGSRLPTH